MEPAGQTLVTCILRRTITAGKNQRQEPAGYDRVPVISSGLYGTVTAAAFAGAYCGQHPSTRPVVALLFFVCLSITISYLWHWAFVLRPREVARNLEEERGRQNTGSEPGPQVPPLHPR